MAKYELSIYGENDEVVKKYETNVCPWGIFIEAAELQEKIKDKPMKEQMEAVEYIIKSVFCNLTSDELKRADTGDVMNTFLQVVSGGQSIKGNHQKNAYPKNLQRARR